jgi:hypothetical protein
MSPQRATRIVIIAPDSLAPAPDDEAAALEVERSRSLRIGLLEAGDNIIAVLPVDTFLPDRQAQLQPDRIIVDAESQARDTLEHVVMATRDARRRPPSGRFSACRCSGPATASIWPRTPPACTDARKGWTSSTPAMVLSKVPWHSTCIVPADTFVRCLSISSAGVRPQA